MKLRMVFCVAFFFLILTSENLLNQELQYTTHLKVDLQYGICYVAYL